MFNIKTHLFKITLHWQHIQITRLENRQAKTRSFWQDGIACVNQAENELRCSEPSVGSLGSVLGRRKRKQKLVFKKSLFWQGGEGLAKIDRGWNCWSYTEQLLVSKQARKLLATLEGCNPKLCPATRSLTGVKCRATSVAKNKMCDTECQTVGIVYLSFLIIAGWYFGKRWLFSQSWFLLESKHQLSSFVTSTLVNFDVRILGERYMF